jgi:AcrR family transcriptional regulator
LANPTSVAAESLRTRKRRETRDRISQAALDLFLTRGFDATTVEDIAHAAEVSKRSFFDYFPTKEDVLFAWQDEFGAAFAKAIAARPPSEPPVKVVEEALVATVALAAYPRVYAIDELIRNTPALHARDYLKYARLEATLAEALIAREPATHEGFRSRILAMVVVGAMRLAAGAWRTQGRPGTAQDYTRVAFTVVWTELAEFIAVGRG